MLASLLPDSADPWLAILVALVLCVTLVRRVFSGAGGASAESSSDGLAAAVEDYPDLAIPRHRHLEMAMDPPDGLHYSNPRVPYTFENEFCWGKYIFFHPPTCAEAEGAGSLDFRDYFKGKKRVWELRMEMHFKRPPEPDSHIHFGIEMEKYVPLSEASKRVVSVAAAAIRKAVGGLYQSPGDDPQVKQGELEKPVCVLPLWAFDQFIETPEGEEPPSLTDLRFPNMGKKRYQRISEYVQELTALQESFRTGPTYTFAFWGNSRFLDVLNWSLSGIPVLTPLDFDKMAGCPPVYAVLYTLTPSTNPEDTRHLSSRKQFYFRCAVWASHRRPPRLRFEALTGATTLMRSDSGDAGAESASPPSLRQRMARSFKDAAMGSVTCCSAARR